MSLKSLLLSTDEKTVRILRRVLSDIEIEVDHCVSADAAVRKITRQRFEAIIVDGSNITLYVNGELVNQAWDVQDIAGKICLQSEGAEIHFRNIKIKEVK